MKINLPKLLPLRCNVCRREFRLTLNQLGAEIGCTCPYCESELMVYEALDHRYRRQVYFLVRDAIEQQIYRKYKTANDDYFDEWGQSTGSNVVEPDE